MEKKIIKKLKITKWKIETHKAVVINGENILLLGNHVAKASTSRVFEGDARSLGTQNLVNVVTIEEFVIEAIGDLDGSGRITILNDDQMVWFKEGPPHFKKIEASDCGYDDIEVIFERWIGVGGRHEKNRGKKEQSVLRVIKGDWGM